MACPTCSGSRRSSGVRAGSFGSARFRASRIGDDEETVLVEYLGTGSRTISPPGSGMTYRFGSDDSHKVRQVRKEDAPRILAGANFKLAEGQPKGDIERAARAEANLQGEELIPAEGRRTTTRASARSQARAGAQEAEERSESEEAEKRSDEA